MIFFKKFFSRKKNVLIQEEPRLQRDNPSVNDPGRIARAEAFQDLYTEDPQQVVEWLFEQAVPCLKTISPEGAKELWLDMKYAWDSQKLHEGSKAEIESLVLQNTRRICTEPGFRNFRLQVNDREFDALIHAVFDNPDGTTSFVPIDLMYTGERYFTCGNHEFGWKYKQSQSSDLDRSTSMDQSDNKQAEAFVDHLLNCGPAQRPPYAFVVSDAPQLDTLPTRIAQVDKIDTVRIDYTKVSDLSPIRSLKRIEKLTLRATPVKSLEAIAGFRNLKYLDIGNSAVQSLGPIAQLWNLETIILDGTSIKTLKHLSGLKNLRYLWADKTSIDSLEPLAELPSLQFLLVSDTAINSLEPLASLKNLYSLDADRTQISSLDALKDYRELTYLSICETPIKSLESLAKVRSLRGLKIEGTDVSDLRPILDLPLGGDADNEGLEFTDCKATRKYPLLAEIASEPDSGLRLARLKAFYAKESELLTP